MNNDRPIMYAIASYHRPQCKTLETLLKLGIKKERITISLNDVSDVEEYKKNHGDKVKIIFKSGKGVACNRNNLLAQYVDGEHIILLDDDIKNFKRYVSDGSKYGKLVTIESASELEEILNKCFAMAEKHTAPFFGFYSTCNQMMITGALQKDGNYSINKLFQGGFCGFVVDRQIRYDESYLILDDYEIIIRNILKGRIIFRRNDCVAEKPPMAGAKGGYYDLYKTGIQQTYMMKLSKQYPNTFTIKKGFKGIRLKRKIKNWRKSK